MSSLRQLTCKNVQSGTVRVFATDSLTGARQELTTRIDSNCLFFGRFDCGDYEVRFRLDLNDRDGQGNPMLDADFYIPGTDKIHKEMKVHPAHHTEAKIEGEGIYEREYYVWEYADASRKLRVTLIWFPSVTLGVKGADVSVSPTVRQRNQSGGTGTE